MWRPTASRQARADPAQHAHWVDDVRVRFCRSFAWKAAGITAFIAIFFIAYFHLLRHPRFPVTVMPLTAVDELIPFQPRYLIVYLSLWLYAGIAPGLQLTLRKGFEYGLWMAALCVAGLSLFYFWPTEVPALDRDGHFGFGILQGIDATGNACPSMHVAVAAFSALWIVRTLRQVGAPWYLRLLNAVWFVAIAYSTLAVKQHVVLDVVAGAALGSAFGLASLAHVGD